MRREELDGKTGRRRDGEDENSSPSCLLASSLPLPHVSRLTPHASPRIALIGLASWDHLLLVDRIVPPGGYTFVREEASLPGGTTSNTAVALARLGADVAMAGYVGDDPQGELLRAALAEAGVNVAWIATRPGERTDGSTVLVGGDPPDRTIYWHVGAQILRGDRLDVTAIFDHDLVVLDVADHALRRFLTDLPAHTAPRARLLGALVYIVDSDQPDELEVALRHDVIVGNQREALALTRTSDIDAATAVLQTAMVGSNLRQAAISRGAAGCRVLTATESWDLPAFPVDVVDTTGAGDAFTAGIAYGLALRWPLPQAARFANALGALATRALGSQSSLPTMPEVENLLQSS